MADRPLRPPRIELGPGLEVPRVLTGLWQVADMERDGTPLDLDAAGLALGEYAGAGFDAFDMADHYGSAEILVGRYLARARPGHATAFTKWCPLPGPMTPEVVREGVHNVSSASVFCASTCCSFTGGNTGIPGTSTPCSSSIGCAAKVASVTSA